MAFRWRSWPEEEDKVSCCSWVTLLKFPFSLLEWCISIEDDRRFDRCNMLWTVVSDNSFVLCFPSRVVHLRMLICILFAFHLVWWRLPSCFPSTSLFRPFARMSLTQMRGQALVQEPLPKPPSPLFFFSKWKSLLVTFSHYWLKKRKCKEKERNYLEAKHCGTSETKADRAKTLVIVISDTWWDPPYVRYYARTLMCCLLWKKCKLSIAW